MNLMQFVMEYYSLIVQQYSFTRLIQNNNKAELILKRFLAIHKKIECPHNMSHILEFVNELLKYKKSKEGIILEAGSFKGGSTSKISVIAKHLGRKLYVFDSFQGLPKNDEPHFKNTSGYSIKGWFTEKSFRGSLNEVKSNVTKYGEIKSCEFIKGYFEDSLPKFNKKILAAYIDVDLASSTKTCLKYLYPLIVPGGVICSQDGDFPLVIDVINNDNFWEAELGVKKPQIIGLGKKVLKIVKPII
tara:strand:+ start:637 stop:1371 length:735 start_codon:yes stop_codon:yes gene_type:complete